MRVIKLMIGICLLATGVMAQDRITTAQIGPYGDQTRVIIAFVDPLPEGYKMQSMIIDLTPLRMKKEEPAEVHLDLTSTIRAVVAGSKTQKTLILQWKKNGELEAKCNGDYKRQDTTPALEKIIATTKAVIAALPSTPREAKDFDLSKELSQRILAMFDSLSAESVPCLRESQ